jgi:hypothetical protein
MNRIHFYKLSMTGLLTVAIAAAGLTAPTSADARDAGKSTKTNVNKNANSNRNTNVNSNKNVNVNANRNVNKNVNVNTNRNVDIDVDIDNDHHHHPVGTAIAVGATVAMTAAIVGSVTYTLPPACTVVIINGLTYQQCGSTWYQPQYVGSSVQYVVVAPLR